MWFVREYMWFVREYVWFVRENTWFVSAYVLVRECICVLEALRRESFICAT